MIEEIIEYKEGDRVIIIKTGEAATVEMVEATKLKIRQKFHKHFTSVKPSDIRKVV